MGPVETWHQRTYMSRPPYAVLAQMAGRSRSPNRAWDRPTQAVRESGTALLKLLLHLYSQCKLSAKDLCVACHHADHARVPGAAFHTYAVSPDSGRFQKHLDAVMPGTGPVFMVSVPMNPGRSNKRIVRDMPMRAMWQSLDDELGDDLGILRCLETPLAQRKPSVMDVPAYSQHPLVVRSRANGQADPLPLAIYVDGVRFISQAAGRSETVLGIWGINMLSRKRHFLGAVKSGDHCQCGCRGWCTLQPLLAAVAWQLEWMAEGSRPPRQYDGSEWPAGDAWARATQPLKCKAMLLYIKGDWSEHSHTMGLGAWNSKFNPCQFCHCCKSELDDSYDDDVDATRASVDHATTR